MGLQLNVGSGQRRFDRPWLNLDATYRPPEEVPDVVADGSRMPVAASVADLVVLSHIIEHEGCGEASGLITEAYRVLRRGGSLLIFTPDLRALAARWLAGRISDYIFLVNLYGAYHGDEHDRHRWLYTPESLLEYVASVVSWSRVTQFNWRPIPQASLVNDWWVAGVEAVK